MLNAALRELIVSALVYAVQHDRIYLASFVVMPDHWHAVIGLRQPWTLPKFMHGLMTFVGRETNRFLKKASTEWQDGYYDTRIRTAKQFAYVKQYTEQNPVKKGLVECVSEWKESSTAQPQLLTDPWPYDLS